MKNLFSIVLTIVALFAFTESKANLVITNTQACAYTVTVGEAAFGTCTAPFPTATINVPPFSVVNHACIPGNWVVGICIQEIFPVPMGACVGLSNPALPLPCAGFPAFVPGFGSCAANVVFTTGFPSTLNI